MITFKLQIKWLIILIKSASTQDLLWQWNIYLYLLYWKLTLEFFVP